MEGLMQDGQEQVGLSRLMGDLAATPGGRCLVIGHPVAHSLSPALHRAAYRELGLDWSYEAVDVDPDGLDAFITGLPTDVRGLSVTMPHKVGIRSFGEGDELVTLVGVANTWVRAPFPEPVEGQSFPEPVEGQSFPEPVEGSAIVRNTDVSGYQLAFASAGVESADSAIVVGNGATARSAVVALRLMGVERLIILARDPQRAADLKTFASGALGMLCQVRPLVPGQAVPSDIVVSTVPEGGADHIADELVAHAGVVFDSVYDPWPTALAAAAQAAGKPVLNGLDLLAGQAVGQVRLMTGGEVSFELLRQAGLDELASRTRH